MARNVLKFFAAGLALVAVAVGVLFLVNYVRYRRSPEYRAEKYFQDLERRYREDTYGGTTPEETLQLFIDALKKGDIELASRYFVVDKRESLKSKIIRIRERNVLGEFVSDLEKDYIKYPLAADESRFIFEIRDHKGNIIQIDIGSGPNGLWKIVNL